MIALAVLFGLVIGLSLGALGGGGSILTVPALVYALGQSPRQATTASLVIVGITALAGAVGHARAGRVRWVAGSAFGLAGIAASVAGTFANRAVNPNVLLLAFAGLMFVVAVAMLRRGTRPEGGSALSARRASTAATVGRVIGTGLVVGFLTGFFGVGGGFVIVPGLVFALGYSMPTAVGTSLLVIAINSAGALLARIGGATFDWAVIVPFTAAAIVGSLAGKRVADRVPAAGLTRGFVVLLLLLAVYVAVRSVSALTS